MGANSMRARTLLYRENLSQTNKQTNKQHYEEIMQKKNRRKNEDMRTVGKFDSKA